MTIYLSCETPLSLGLDGEALIRQVAQAVLEEEGCPLECCLEVLFTDNASIREINRETRGIDAPTDVLSFPALLFETPGDLSSVGESFLLRDPDSDALILGDMVLSLEKVLSQALEYGHSVKRELAFLTAHSMLHLLGYDHEEEAERLLMEEKQEKILRSLGITREL